MTAPAAQAPSIPDSTGAQTLRHPGRIRGCPVFESLLAVFMGACSGGVGHPAADGGAAHAGGSAPVPKYNDEDASTGSVGMSKPGPGGQGTSGCSGTPAAPSGKGLPNPSASSTDLPQSRSIGGASLEPDAFWPPTGQSCATELSASGSVPTTAPQAFLDECAGCHGASATGHAGYPNITGARPFDTFQTIVRTGLSNGPLVQLVERRRSAPHLRLRHAIAAARDEAVSSLAGVVRV